MKAKDISEYAKSRPYPLLFFIAAVFLSCNKDFSLYAIVAFVFNFIMEFLHYKNRVEFSNTGGLTDEQYEAKKFSDEWAETRQHGLTHYCLHNGGVISGSILSIFIGMIFIGTKVFGDLKDDFSIMMAIIWKSWVTAFIICTVLYRYIWVVNEKKFLRHQNRAAL